MENQTNFPFGKDIFAKAFQEFDEQAFFQRLEDQVKPQSYYHKYKGFKDLISTLSYLFNIISAFTASYLIFWLTQWLTGIAIVAYAFSAVFLFFLEKLKRKSSSEFFQVWFFEKKIASGWLGLSFMVFLASVASTYYGTDKATWDFAPPAPLVSQDSTLQSLYAQLEITEAQISEARGTKWKGTTTRTSQKTVKELSEQKTFILTEIGRRENGKDVKNDGITQNHTVQIKITASTLAWLTVLFEVLFECCIAFIWYYYHRSFVERKIMDSLLPSPILDEESVVVDTSVKALLQELQEQIRVLQQQKNINIPPLPSSNGHQKNGSVNGTENETKRPIGFMTNAQRMSSSVLQDVVTDEKMILDDRHTIAHKDSRTGEIKRYTLARVANFISHYEKSIEEAIKTNMEATVLANRQKWLAYWQRKQQELLLKQQS